MTYRLVTAYDGANADGFHVEAEDDRLIMHYPPETCVASGISHDYAWSFNFGVENPGDAPLELDVLLNCESETGWSGQPFALYTSRDPSLGFRLEDEVGKSDAYTRYVFKARVLAGQTVYFSNTLARHYATLESDFRGQAKRFGARVSEYGRSVEGRGLYALEYGDLANGKPTVVITTGVHPPEGDTYASEALADHLGSEPQPQCLERLNVVLIPMVNPDGFVHGINGSNVNGINLYWEFRPRRWRTRAPEAYYLWKYLLELKPALYLDFHAYVTQKHKHMRPYLKPNWMYHGKEVRQVVEAMDGFLSDYCDGRAVRGYTTYGRTTLAYLLTRELNTVTYTKFHFHLGEGVPAVRRHAVAIFDGLCEILRDQEVTTAQQIVRPRGWRSRLLLAGAVLWGETKGYLRIVRDLLKS